MSLNISFRGNDIPVNYSSVSKELAEKAIATPMFITWKERCEKKPDEKKYINIKSLEIQSVDMFGPRRVGFIKLKAEAYLVFNGEEIPRPVPGIALLRGDSVGILVVLSCEDGKKYTVLVEQTRIPIGDVACLEMPAGMIDDENVKYAAVKEMEEECGIILKKSDLICLTSNKMLPSPGGCDEAIELYYFEKKVTVEELKEMEGRLHGKSDEGEHIQLQVVPFDEAPDRTGDSKLLCAMFLYEEVISNIIPVSFRGNDIPIKHPRVRKEIAEKAIATPMFKNWLERCEKKPDEKKYINIKGVEIQSVDMFGPRRVGFIKLKAEAYLVFNGEEIPRAVPGIALLRGDSVGILVVFSCEDGRKYTVLVEQTRIPIGDVACLEMPAGMIDDENVKHAAVKEMEEECGIKLKKSDLISLTSNKMLPSPGSCDEAIDLYYFEKKVTVKELKEMEGRLHGKSDEGEHIQLQVVPFEEASSRTGDSKLLCALLLYKKKVLSNKKN